MPIKINCAEKTGKIKPMHAVNNGPIKARSDQKRGNFDKYAEAQIPYARTHDAAFWSGYGGEHTVDISAVFPNFENDPYKEESYDFAVTDNYLKTIMLADTKVFYRLGSKIEHGVKKYGTLPPADFEKWAVICEHIIRHYNEGWADGFEMDISYWEIWNEPDLDPDDSDNKRTWGGTKAQFLDLFEITAKHLKKCFPKLKIGGPAIAYNSDWAADFICEMSRRKVPMDFLSWHIYAREPKELVERGTKFKELLDKYGYKETESILNEWNYVKGWSEEFVYSIKTIIGMKGAAFTASCMCEAQNSSIDMLMYYDARPCGFNGMFDFYTYETLKGYYPFKMFSMLYKAENQLKLENDIENIYAVAAGDSDNPVAMVCYYTDDDTDKTEKTFEIEFDNFNGNAVEVYILDNEHDAEKCIEADGNKVLVTMKPNTVIQLAGKK